MSKPTPSPGRSEPRGPVVDTAVNTQPQDKGGERKSRLFLSYSRKDLAFAESLRENLVDAGYDVLLDRTDIAAGEDWQVRLGRLIVEADTVVFCLSPHSIASSVCGWEVSEAERLGKRVLPVVLRKVAEAAVPATLSKLNFIFMDGRAKHKGLSLLKDALEAELPWLREHTRLGDLALQWQSKPGNAGILRGSSLDAAERWIASQPRSAALATDHHRNYITASRKAASARNRNWIGGAAGIVVLSLALAGWSEINRREAERQRDRAEKVLAAATQAAGGLVFDLAQEFRNVQGVPVAVIRKILDKAQGLQNQLGEVGEATPDLLRMESSGLNELSITLLAQGDTQGALEAARKSLSLAQRLVAKDPGNVLWQRDLSVSHNKVSEALGAQGELEAALVGFQTAMGISVGLAEQDPGNAEWLRDVSVSHERIGSILATQNNLAGAMESFRASLSIRQGLVAKQPDNQDLLRDVSISHEKIADVLLTQGDLAAALAGYRESLVIREQLVEQSPESSDQLQRLSTSHERIGTILLAQGDFDGALQSYKANMAIAEKLARQDPGNVDWQWGLLVGHEKIGDVSKAQGNLADALASYLTSIAVVEKLVAADPHKLDWQRGLSVSHAKIGHVLLAQGNIAGARARFEADLSIMDRLVGQNAGNAEWQRGLWISCWNLAAAGGDPNVNFRRALEVLKATKANGTLAPPDEPYIQQLESIVAGLPQ